MKKKITCVSVLPVFLAVCMLIAINTDGYPEEVNFEPPRLALKLLADSTVDPCPLCAEKSRKQAFAMLNKIWYPGKIIRSSIRCRFRKDAQTQQYEFLVSCYRKREQYREVPGKGKIFFPLITFKFLTKKNRLVGVSKRDLTNRVFENMYRSSPGETEFIGEIMIISFKYGDGNSFSFFRKKNNLQVYCRVLKMKRAR